MRTRINIISILLIAGLSANCAAILVGNAEDEFATDPGALCQKEKSANSQTNGSINSTCVKATSAADWVYFSLSSNSAVSVASPTTSAAWDLGFKRFRIKLNGGVSGPGAGSLKLISGAAGFSGTTQATAGGYSSDANFTMAHTGACYTTDGVNYQFLNDFTATSCWFTYDSSTHKLDARDQFYYITDAAGNYYKLQTTSYYNDNGTSAYISFKWAAVAAP